MNALNLFKSILMPHLWLNHDIAPAIIAAGIGAGASLLGGGGDSGSDTISGFAALPKWLKQKLKGEGVDAAQGLFDQGQQSYFPGQTFADLDPNQLAGLQSQLDFSQNQLPGQLDQVNQSFGNALNSGSLFSDPSVQAGLGTIENRANRNFQENILPNLRQQATGTGNQFSSKAEQSERLAGRDLQGVISDAQGSFLGQQLGSARGLQGQTIGNAPNITQLGLQPGSNQFDVGSVFQGQNQQGISDQFNAFNFNQQAPSNQVNQYLAQLQGIGNTGGSAGFSSQPGTSVNGLSGALGGAILGSSVYNQLAPQFSGGGGGTGNLSFAGGNGANALTPNSGFWGGGF
jgi:hypothetical protein